METKGKKLIVFLVVLAMTSLSGFAFAEHFQGVQGTPYWVDFLGEKFLISDEPATIGDEIGVFTKDGLLCGVYAVKKPGQYGVLHVYGDDPSTPVVEGALPGERLIFKVWDNERALTITVLDEDMWPYSAGSAAKPNFPIIWTTERDIFGLNILLTK